MENVPFVVTVHTCTTGQSAYKHMKFYITMFLAVNVSNPVTKGNAIVVVIGHTCVTGQTKCL